MNFLRSNRRLGYQPIPTSIEASESGPEATIEGEFQDDVLTPDEDLVVPELKPWRSVALRFGPLRAVATLLLLTLGVFVSSCPIARQHLPYPLRPILIMVDASLVTFPSLVGKTFSPLELARRIAISYLGLIISMFALVGAADDVHIDSRLVALLWFRTYHSFQFGYISRMVIAVVGFYIQRFSGLYSMRRILGTWLLSIFWIYLDLPTTLIDLARGRGKW